MHARMRCDVVGATLWLLAAILQGLIVFPSSNDAVACPLLPSILQHHLLISSSPVVRHDLGMLSRGSRADLKLSPDLPRMWFRFDRSRSPSTEVTRIDHDASQAHRPSFLSPDVLKMNDAVRV